MFCRGIERLRRQRSHARHLGIGIGNRAVQAFAAHDHRKPVIFGDLDVNLHAGDREYP